MRFNAQKCYILSSRSKSTHMYSLNGVFLKQVQQHPYLGVIHPYLGVIVSDDLKWGKHIAYISWKAGATVGFLRQNLRNCPKECRRLAYIALVRSRLEMQKQCGTHTINRTSRSWKECRDRQPASSQKTTELENRVA